MICSKCGSEIEEGNLYCSKCGAEVQLVPDFTDLGELLTDEKILERKRKRETEKKKEEELLKRKREEAKKREEDKIRKEEEQQKELQLQKKRTIITIIISAVVSLCIIGIIFLFLNSVLNKKKNTYDYQMKVANEEYLARNLDGSLESVEKALKIKETSEANTLKAKIFFDKKKDSDAIALLESVILEDPTYGEAYEVIIPIYEKQEEYSKIKTLLDACNDETIKNKYPDYMVEPVVFTVAEGTYTKEKELELVQEDAEIYYTTDGKDPTTKSKKYSQPIVLERGSIIVKAIAVNEKGIESDIIEQKYQINIPKPSKPKVSPSSGTFTNSTQITIYVPKGCTAYYEWGDKTPTKNSNKYEEPFWMWKGNNTLSVILIDEEGRKSEVTKVQYNRKYKETPPPVETSPPEPPAETDPPETQPPVETNPPETQPPVDPNPPTQPTQPDPSTPAT